MGVTGFSHAAIGVSDPDRSMAFYRDVLGLTVCMDTEEKGGDIHRRAIYLRWKPESMAGFIVLDYHLNRPPHGTPLKMFDVGTHHISFSVDDVQAVFERAQRFGCEVPGVPRIHPGYLWGMPGDEKPAVKTLIVRDPDGNYIQVDEYLRAPKST